MAILRDYSCGDEAKIISLLSTILKEYGYSVELSGIDSDLLAIDDFYRNRGGAFRVLLVDNDIVGFYGISYFACGTCELRKIYLQEDMRGGGLGKLMLEDSFMIAKELGYCEMVLETSVKFTRAIHMYQRFGFRNVPLYRENPHADYAMCKPLV